MPNRAAVRMIAMAALFMCLFRKLKRKYLNSISSTSGVAKQYIMISMAVSLDIL